MTQFPVTDLRASFPKLNNGEDFVFFDNAAGAQIPQCVLKAVTWHLVNCNVQRGGPYVKSQRVDARLARARQSVCELVNAYRGHRFRWWTRPEHFVPRPSDQISL